MQLLLAGYKTDWTEELVEKISSFKYRNDVHVIVEPSNQTVNTLIACAYAFVYPSIYDHLPVNILRSMQAGVPVITSDIPVIRELAGNAVLYADAMTPESFAQSILRIYKDELFREQLISTAKSHMEQSKTSDTATGCWNFLGQA